MPNKNTTLPEDPNVRLPAAVRATIEQTNSFYTPPAEDTPPEGTTPASLEAASAAHPDDDSVTLQGNPPAEPPASPTPPEGTTPPSEPPHDPDEDENSQSWAHRFKSMKGRYEALKHRTDQQIADLSDRLASTQQLLATLHSTAAPAPAEPTEHFVTPEQREMFGDELLDVAAAAARDSLNPEIKRLQAKIDALLASTSANSRQQVYKTLNDHVPNWEQVNTHPEFVAWLRLPDPYSGVIRQQLLNTAFEQNNAPQVLAFFKGFLAEKATVAPALQPTPDPAATAPGVKVDLASLAAPGGAKSAPTPAAAEKPVITAASISKFYLDVAQGKYAGREEEKMRREREIFDAQSEGRIR